MSRGLKKILFINFLYLWAAGCNSLEEAEKKKLKQMNAHAEPIYRNHGEHAYQLPPPKSSPREKYPWEEKQ